MKKSIFILLFFTSLFAGCDDNDSFSSSSSNVLSMIDTLSMDTVFSTIPSSAKIFWIHNNSGDGIRIKSVALDKGNQTGFRVNVDGADLTSNGYQLNNLEVRKGDSIQVFVEVTTGKVGKDTPQLVSDNLTFTLESGVTQKVNLKVMSWDATMVNNLEVKEDMSLGGDTPIVVYGTIKVLENATLTINPGTTLYFASDGGIDVYGTLKCVGTSDENITLRSYRLDKMFDNLYYDGTDGLWQGITINNTSYGNEIGYADIHSATTALMITDTVYNAQQKLKIYNSIIHNNSVYGVCAYRSNISMENCQLTNAKIDCAYIVGGVADINGCTIGQFYNFKTLGDHALNVVGDSDSPLILLDVKNTIITGYHDDEVYISVANNNGNDSVYYFDHCLLRTPEVSSSHITDNIFEDTSDTLTGGYRNFVMINEEYKCDFHLDSVSKAIDAANTNTIPEIDIEGNTRRRHWDIGAYQYKD